MKANLWWGVMYLLLLGGAMAWLCWRSFHSEREMVAPPGTVINLPGWDKVPPLEPLPSPQPEP